MNLYKELLNVIQQRTFMRVVRVIVNNDDGRFIDWDSLRALCV